MAVDVGSAVGYLDLDISGFLANLKTANSEANKTSKNITETFSSKMENVGKKLTTAGSAMTKGITLPLVTAGTAAFKFSSDYETAMAKVSTIADPAAKSIGSMKDEITDLSNQTGIAATALAEATYEAISSGIKTADAVSFVSQATKLSEAGFTTAASAVDVLTTMINAYGMSAKDATHLSDVLIKTQNLGKTTVDQLASSIGKVIPTANAFGVSVEQLGTAYSYMTSRGIATAESTTYLNSMLNELGKSGTKTADVLKSKTGKTFQELSKEGYSLRDVLEIINQSASETGVGFNDLWQSQEAGKAALSLLGVSTEEYNATLTDFKTTVGDTEDAYKKMADTTEKKFDRALNSGRNALITVGDALKEVLIPMIEKATAVINKFTNWFKSLSDGQKEFIVKTVAVVAALGPLLMIVGQILTGVSGLVKVIGGIPKVIKGIPGMVKGAFGAITTSITHLKEGFVLAKAGLSGFAFETSFLGGVLGSITAPIAILIGILAVLAGAFVTLWRTNEDFRNKFGEIWGQIKASFEGFTTAILMRINEFGFEFESIAEVISAVWKGFCDLLGPIFIGAFQLVADTLDAIFGIILGLVDVFTGIFTGDWDTFANGIRLIFGSVWEWIVDLFTNVGNTLKGILDVICGWFGTTWDQTWTNIKQFFIDTWNGILTFFSTMGQNISTSFQTFVTNIQTFFANLPQNIGFALGYVITSIALWIIELGAKAIEAGSTFITNVVTFFQELPGNILNFLTSAAQNIQTWVSEMPGKAREMGSNFINSVVTFFVQLPGNIQNFLNQAINAVMGWIGGMVSAGSSAASGLVDAVISGVSGLPGMMSDIGSNIVQGVWNGIQGAIGWFTGAVNSFFSGIVSGAKAALGIQSPSTVMRDQVGKQIPPGITAGVKYAMPAAIRNIQGEINKGIQSISVDNVMVGVDTQIQTFATTLKGLFEDVAVWFESVSSRIGKSISVMQNDVESLIRSGQTVVNQNGTLGYIRYGGFTQRQSQGYESQDSRGKNDTGADKQVFNFYSPKPIDEIQASRLMRQTQRDLAEKF